MSRPRCKPKASTRRERKARVHERLYAGRKGPKLYRFDGVVVAVTYQQGKPRITFPAGRHCAEAQIGIHVHQRRLVDGYAPLPKGLRAQVHKARAEAEKRRKRAKPLLTEPKLREAA